MTNDKEVKIPAITQGTVPDGNAGSVADQVLGLLFKSGEKIRPFGNDKNISDVVILSNTGNAEQIQAKSSPATPPKAKLSTKPKGGNVRK